MLKVNLDQIKKRELATAKLRKLSLDAINAHQLFDAKSLSNLNLGLNEETRSQLLRLDESGPLRRLMIVPDDYLARCRDLETRFPNFSGYINDFLLPSLALSHIRKASFQLPPTVFVGSPGVGKTLFVSALAEAFYLDFERVNLETSQASLELVGTARGWSNAQPGLLLRWMIRSEFANGICVLEELDKADDKNSPFKILEPLRGVPTATSITLLDVDGNLIGQVGGELGGKNFAVTGMKIDEVSQYKNRPFTIEGKDGEPDIRALAQMLPTGMGSVIVADSLEKVDKTLSQLRFLFLILGTIALIAIAMAARWIIALGLKPLEAVEDTAEAIAAGDLSARLPALQHRPSRG